MRSWTTWLPNIASDLAIGKAPGPTQLTRRPAGPHSRPTARTRLVTPALPADEWLIPGAPPVAVELVIITAAPAVPPSSNGFAQRWRTLNAAQSVLSIVWRSSAGEIRMAGPRDTWAAACTNAVAGPSCSTVENTASTASGSVASPAQAVSVPGSSRPSDTV